ncbi:hypothetical protein [uncultured Paraburkholderia sp.]|uniref:hypothetical protein n=1 Tax=uncultured Paraburkholderia sp. TaxID=1822466 RepID=UPI0025987662|nr:hypothetical protein [uncultured Paraburkholderia sp.]
MLNGSRAVRISTINFSGTRFGRKGPQQSGFMHLAKLTTGRQGLPASATCRRYRISRLVVLPLHSPEN